MTVIEFAQRALEHAERQYELGEKFSHSDMVYWSAYLDGARDQKEEDDRGEYPYDK